MYNKEIQLPDTVETNIAKILPEDITEGKGYTYDQVQLYMQQSALLTHQYHISNTNKSVEMRKSHNYWKPTAKKWKQLQTGIKAIVTAISGSVFIENNPKLAFGILIGGLVLNEVIEFFAPEERAKSPYSGLNIKTDEEGK